MPGDVFKTINNLEGGQRPTGAKIYEAYDYKPAPSPGRVEDLSDFKITPEAFEVAKKSTLEFFDDPTSQIFKPKTINIGNIEFCIMRRQYGSSSPEFGIRFRANDLNITAELSCVRNTSHNSLLPNHSWFINRRFISEQLRGQEIGSQMLQILENAISHVATKEQNPQLVKIEARQVEVVMWALKNGYKPATPKDNDLLNLLYSGDKSKILLATDPSWGENFNGERRLGAIYEVEHLKDVAKSQGIEPLTVDNLRQNLAKLFPEKGTEYIEGALTINFRKEIKPKT